MVIAIDDWKLPIFERHLTLARYSYETKPGLVPHTLSLIVKSNSVKDLELVARSANTEAARTRVALHFGWRAPGGGHYLSDAAGRTPEVGFPWSMALMDGGLLKNGTHADIPDGRVFWTCGGNPLWHAFFWWDRSGDTRGASNSGFYVRGFAMDQRVAAFEFAKQAFPGIVARQNFPLVLQAPP